MPGLLKIKCFQPPVVGRGQQAQHDFDIADLLALVENERAVWAWALFPMGERTEISGDELPDETPFGGMTVWELSAKVDDTENGIRLSWDQLRTFAKAVRQTIWGTFIACADQDAFCHLKSLYLDEWGYVDRATDEYYALTEVVFQAVDSSYWLVYAKDDLILRGIGSAFRDVETLRTWR